MLRLRTYLAVVAVLLASRGSAVLADPETAASGASGGVTAPGAPVPFVGPMPAPPPPPPEDSEHLPTRTEPESPPAASFANSPSSTSTSSSSSSAGASGKSTPRSAIEPLAFQVSGLAVLQSGGNSFSPEIGWVPRARLTDRLALKLAIDGAVLKGVGSNLVSVDYQALISWGPEAIKLNVGGGGQTWFGQGTSPIATAQVEAGFGSSRFLAIFDRLIAGYAYYPIPNRATQEITIGGGIEF